MRSLPPPPRCFRRIRKPVRPFVLDTPQETFTAPSSGVSTRLIGVGPCASEAVGMIANASALSATSAAVSAERRSRRAVGRPPRGPLPVRCASLKAEMTIPFPSYRRPFLGGPKINTRYYSNRHYPMQSSSILAAPPPARVKSLLSNRYRSDQRRAVTAQ